MTGPGPCKSSGLFCWGLADLLPAFIPPLSTDHKRPGTKSTAHERRRAWRRGATWLNNPLPTIVNSLEFSRRAEHIHQCLNSTVCYANELNLISIPLFSKKIINITRPSLGVYLTPVWKLRMSIYWAIHLKYLIYSVAHFKKKNTYSEDHTVVWGNFMKIKRIFWIKITISTFASTTSRLISFKMPLFVIKKVVFFYL